MSQRIIDAHVHLVQAITGIGAGGELRYIGNCMAQYASGETIRILPDLFPGGTVSPEAILALMDENHVERAVLLQGNYLGFQNLYSWEAQQKYPDRFKTAASYDPYSRFVDRIRHHLFEELGIGIVKFELSTGSGLMCNHHTFPLDGDMMEAEYRYADEHNLICVMDIGKPGTESWQIDALRRSILRHPHLRFVVCHLLASSRTTLAVMERGLRQLALPNVWFDLAALPHNIQPEEYPYETAVRFVERAASIVSDEKLLFGSDIPTTLKEDTYAHLTGFISDAPQFSPKTKDRILYRNAAELYFDEVSE